MKTFARLTLICVSFGILGCNDAPPPSPVAAPAQPAPPAPQIPDVKPEYTLEISSTDSTPKTYTVTWTARVNTGGWTMKTDQVLVEDSMGATAARIYAILEQPGPDTIVTQAVETLTAKHEAGERKIDKAELSIKRMVRGANTDFPALYSIVKETGP